MRSLQADLESIVSTAREIAAGMAYLHADNILHGDLTAGNILLVSSSKDHRQFSVKVRCLLRHKPYGAGGRSRPVCMPQRLSCAPPRRALQVAKHSPCPHLLLCSGAHRSRGHWAVMVETSVSTGSRDTLTHMPLDRHPALYVQIADFGLSRVMVETSVSTGSYGTVTHMPPELLTTGRLSRSADTYAFGVLLWEMYTGQRPWAGMLQMQVRIAATVPACARGGLGRTRPGLLWQPFGVPPPMQQCLLRAKPTSACRPAFGTHTSARSSWAVSPPTSAVPPADHLQHHGAEEAAGVPGRYARQLPGELTRLVGLSGLSV